MALSALIGQLKRVGQMLNRWVAEFRFTVGLSVIVTLFFCLALADFMTRYSRQGRFIAWGFLLVLATVLVGLIMKTLSRNRTPEAVASHVEKAFPELDNHLINFLQFSAANVKDSFVKAYIKMEIPHWGSLDFGVMKDKRTLRRAQLSLGLACILLLLPLPFLGRAWTVAMVRVLNPFSELTPVSLSRIVSVTPGDAVVVQGGDVNLACVVEGKAGHEVLLDVRPADGEQKTYNLGSIKGEDEETFTHSLLKVTTVTKYRFRVGDAYVRGWKKIALRPPLAFSDVKLTVTPPAYMGLSSKKYDSKAEAIDIPYGSKVSMAAECNTGLKSLSLSGVGSPVKLSLGGSSRNGAFDVVVTNGAALTVSAVDAHGDEAETTLGFNLLWDRPPVLTVKYPQKPVHLPAGSAPTIDFSATDDFGFGEIRIEQISAKGDSKEPAKVLKTYSREGEQGQRTYISLEGRYTQSIGFRVPDSAGCR